MTKPIFNDVSKFMTEISNFFDLICSPNTNERYEFVKTQIEKYLIQTDKKEIKILDLASGTGDMCIKFSENGFNATGIDFSKGMINVSKKKNKKMGLNAKFYLEDIRSFTGTDKYDCIYGNSFIWIHGIKDLEKALENASNLLAQGGIFIIDIPNRTNFLNTYRPFAAKCVNTSLKTYSKIVMYTDYPNRNDPLISVNQTYLVHEITKLQHNSISCDFKFRFHSLEEIKELTQKYGIKLTLIEKDYGIKFYNEPKDYQVVFTKEA
ncbi:class I SAM-dependent methyltransferase [Clostridiaceae bacterium M8S5]|nr:class I SAM-dependent methyltransferase [Clostridiaceae bacterium M8S5]